MTIQIEESFYQPRNDDAIFKKQRWVAYVAPDRRILWSDVNGLDPDFGGIIFGLTAGERTFVGGEYQALLDTAFATRQPQCAVMKGGGGASYSLKVFPDIAQSGKLMGVILVIENGAPTGDGNMPANCDLAVKSILELSLCGIILYDPIADRIHNVNRHIAQQTGYSLAELEGMSGSQLFGGENAALLANIFRRMSTAGEGMIWGQALDINTRNGERERYFASLRIVDAMDETSVGPVLLVSLEAAEKEAKSGVPREGPNPHFIMEALQDGLFEYDAARRVFHYSESYAEIFGDSGAPGGPGKPLEEWFDEMYPGEARLMLHHWRSLLKSGVRYRLPYRIRDRRGKWRWIFSTIHAILNNDDGRPTRVLGLHLDITDAMHSEARLIDAEEHLRTIFENAGLGIAVTDGKGILTTVNPALAVMLGRDRNDLCGKKLSSFAEPEYGKEMRMALTRLLRGGRRECMTECLFPRPDGRQVWITFNATLSGRASDGERRVIIMAEDVTSSRISREKLQYEATHDVMTGAWNRWILLERLGQHINLAQRHRQPMTFCICDLDHFKGVNDIHGHQAGDHVLIRFVDILKEAVRETDIVGRYGGEEFGIVFPGTDVKGATLSLRRALDNLRRVTFVDDAGEEFQVTATFGISGVSEQSCMRSVVLDADKALYRGKKGGRNRVEVAREGVKRWFRANDACL